jgi:signal transduction histidine kinase
MKWTRRSIWELVAIAATTVVVCVLATLQYRWTDEISRSEGERLKGLSATSVRNFAQEFSYDFERLCENFELDPEAPPATLESRVVHQYAEWENIAAHPALIAGVYIWKGDAAPGPNLERFTATSRRFQDISWPMHLASLRQVVTREFGELSSKEVGDRDAVYYPWTFYGTPPALIRPIFYAGKTPGAQVEPVGFIAVEFDSDFLKEQYLPELVTRDFGELALRSFGIAVRTPKAPYETVYVSEDFPVSAAAPDAAVNLFNSVAEEARRRGHPQFQAFDAGEQWELIVQHPAGSLGFGVPAWRTRNLAISFGLLAILAGTVVLVLTVARRAERLAKLQMEFVAGVSHELCTPLAVINSAAENLADGVLDGSPQIQEYGVMIREQGRRLERLVDEVLLFASGRFGRSGYELRPVEIGAVLEENLADSESMLRDSGFTVDKEISPDLPHVIADSDALGKCIQNLVSNAMKYSGPRRWLSVRAQAVRDGSTAEVQISVADKGIGIAPAELAHVFEPFYRGEAVRDGQIRGVGLGLYLVKRMMEAMGGRVTVSSEIGKGSVFQLHLPVFDAAEFHETDGAKPEVAKA